MKVLVTGGSGFIGSHTIDCLLEHGHEVRTLDALIPQVHGNNRTSPDNLAPRAELVVGAVEDPAAIFVIVSPTSAKQRPSLGGRRRSNFNAEFLSS
jgi:nucleoside-diphosphate-sugar epimerase